MAIYKQRKFWMLGLSAFVLFTAMICFRLGFHLNTVAVTGENSSKMRTEQPPGETWMDILQNDTKIGYSHRRLATAGDGYLIDEKTVMNINTMGLVQEIRVVSSSTTNQDFALEEFKFSIASGTFHFVVNGQVKEKILHLYTHSATDAGGAGTGNTLEIPLENRPYLTSAILPATMASGLKPGNEMMLFLFDPSTMGQAPATVKMVGSDPLIMDGEEIVARKITLSFKGATQSAWVDDEGQVLKERGMLGITLVKTTRKEAMGDIDPEGMADLTTLVSVPSNVKFHDPGVLTNLQIKLSGVDIKKISLAAKGPSQHRQTWNKDILTIEKETLGTLPASIPPKELAGVDKKFILPGPFIQSDDDRIQRIARRLVSPDNTPLENIGKLVAWIQANIRRQPVISLPNALSTLTNRMGDCNEHAALMAAFCRSVGIPASIEAGLVYLKGRFYYHAWNTVFIGRWITVDALFNQIPADVTHISLTAGSQESQLDLMGVMGKIKLEVLAYNIHGCKTSHNEK